MSVTSVTSRSQCESVFSSASYVVALFVSSGHGPSSQMSAVLAELAKEYTSVTFIQVDVSVEGIADIPSCSGVKSVPTTLVIHGGQLEEKLEGASVPKLLGLAGKVAKQVIEENNKKLEALNARLHKLINQSRVMLFMKGDPTTPKCGFSRKMVEQLTKAGCTGFSTFNILEDPEVREGLKKYSNWPTYPQLYVEGQLVGGLDVVTELLEAGELQL